MTNHRLKIILLAALDLICIAIMSILALLVRFELDPDNELFEVFLSAFRRLCEAENIICHPFQAQISDKDGNLFYHTLPMTLRNPKKEKIVAYGFPYQIEF